MAKEKKATRVPKRREISTKKEMGKKAKSKAKVINKPKGKQYFSPEQAIAEGHRRYLCFDGNEMVQRLYVDESEKMPYILWYPEELAKEKKSSPAIKRRGK